MIPNASKTVHHVGQVAETIEMTMDQTRAGQIAMMKQLRKDLYQNPRLAPIRELSTNARDSHLEAGNKDPIDVTLPTASHPQFVVADHGTGLSIDDIRNVYSVFGASTKRTSNEFTGQLGFGCKAPLAYALSFSIDAVKGGVRTLAMVTVDEQDVGVIKILDTSSTDLPNGVTIAMPVKAEDVITFCNEALLFFQFWRPGTVLVDGAEPAFYGNDATLWLDDDVAITKGGGNSGTSKLVMGGVAYPFTHSFAHAIVAWVPMGSVDFTPAREALQQTELTRDTINTVVGFARDRVGQEIVKAVVAAPTAFERAKVLAEWRFDRNITPDIQKVLAGFRGDLSIKIKEKPAWSSGWRAVSKVEREVPWTTLAETSRWIITGYPNRTIGTSHKDRIAEYGITVEYCLLPDDADEYLLEGRPNVTSWAEIVEATPRVRGKYASRKTLYSVLSGRNHLELEKLDPALGPICVVHHNVNVNVYGDRHPEAQFVAIAPRQHDRFMRLHPGAVMAHEYMEDQKEAALTALTEDDKLTVHGNQAGMAFLKKYANELLDPELKSVVLATRSTSVRVARATKLGIAVPTPKVFTTLLERYPLLHIIPAYERVEMTEDLLLYVQTKYAFTAPEALDVAA